MQSSLRSLRLLIVTLCLSLAQPFDAVAQTNAPVPLPPTAQEAFDKGIIAAKVPDYLLAIRFFEEARKIAPQAPVIYLNLGIAEAKIPGRELRAIAWFGAYLAAYPDAPNAAAVKEQMEVLDVKNQSNVLQLIKAVQDVASQMSAASQSGDSGLRDVTQLWLDFGDMTAAQKAANFIQDKIYESSARYSIAIAQALKGDFTGAQKTSDLIQVALYKSRALIRIAEVKIKAGDLAGAKILLRLL
jgi:tetratricopeptide (TPR) repeat protein